MLLRVHARSDQRQQMRAVPGRSHTPPMGFGDHTGVDVPAPERPGLDVLRTEGLGKGHRSPDMAWVRFWLDPAPLLLIEGPITVELKAAVADPRPWKHSGGYGVRIRNQGSHRRALIAHGSDPEIEETGKQVRPVCVRV